MAIRQPKRDRGSEPGRGAAYPVNGREAQRSIQSVIVQVMAEGVALVRARDGVIVFTNPKWNQMFGYDEGELIGTRIAALTAVTDRTAGQTAARIRASLKREGAWHGEVKNLRKDGSAMWCSASVAAFRHPEHGVVWVEVHTDISGQKRVEDEFRALLESSPDAIVMVDRNGRITVVNPQAEALFGYSRGELIGKPVELLMPRALRESHALRRNDYLADPKVRPMGTGLELNGLHKDGHEIPVEISLTPLVRDQTIVVAGTIRDMTHQRLAEGAQARLAAIVESSGEAIVGLSRDGTIESWNYGAERLYGYRRDEILGRPASVLMDPGAADERVRMFDMVLAGATLEETETEDVRKDGSLVTVAASLSPVRGPGDEVIGAARIARDITERKRFEHELKFYADRDPLTGQYNRRRFAEELERQNAFASRHHEESTVIVADLDNFKYINDTVGHRAGDQLIIRVARVLRERLRESDVLARLGGDEFAALLPATDLEQAEVVAESLRGAVRGLTAVVGGRKLRCTISIGLAPLGAHTTAEDAMAKADMAMYDAKHQGRDRVAVGPVGGSPGKFARHLSWAERLYDALEQDSFELYSQPIIDLATGEVDRHELLLRMRTEHGQLLLPGAFISSAERLGVIGEIDRWVAREAIRLLANDRGGSAVYQVNASGISVTDPSLLTFLDRELADADVDPGRLVVEVTETAAISDVGAAGDFIQGLSRIGCDSALDDFGSGFASFTYLRHIPVQYLKIDGDFVRDLPASPNDRVLVKAIVDAAHGLGKKTIAEHVGSQESLDLLREFGVEYGQGYFLGRPIPTAQLIA